MDIVVAQDAADLADRAALLVATELLQLDGPATLALAGGSTPTATHAALASTGVDWGSTCLWLGDERWVPTDHPDSNAAMARRTLADVVHAELVAPDTSLDDPADAALQYEAALAVRWIEREGRRGPDVVMLGIGDDGHTASLFPGTSALEEQGRGYVANWVASTSTWRLTATFPLLWSARHVVFLVAGEGKAQMVWRIVDQGAPYPAQRVAAGARRVTWLLDAAAASRLNPT